MAAFVRCKACRCYVRMFERYVKNRSWIICNLNHYHLTAWASPFFLIVHFLILTLCQVVGPSWTNNVVRYLIRLIIFRSPSSDILYSAKWFLFVKNIFVDGWHTPRIKNNLTSLACSRVIEFLPTWFCRKRENVVQMLTHWNKSHENIFKIFLMTFILITKHRRQITCPCERYIGLCFVRFYLIH